jgi:DNA-binding XRE family transcriptional regulator
MLAVVRTPLTNKPTLEIRGQIPNWMMSRLKKEYKNSLVIKDEESTAKNEDLINIFNTPWFSSIDSQMNPGDNLKVYRENAGLSQAELGKKLGNIPRQNISSMEKGKRGISKENAKKLAQVLHAPISRFI